MLKFGLGFFCLTTFGFGFLDVVVFFALTVCFVLALRLVFAVAPCPLGRLGTFLTTFGFGFLGLAVFFTLTVCFVLALRLVFAVAPCSPDRLGAFIPESRGGNVVAALRFDFLDLAACFALALLSIFAVAPCPSGCLGAFIPGSRNGDVAATLHFGLSDLTVARVFAVGFRTSGPLDASTPGSGGDAADALGIADGTIATGCLARSSFRCLSKISIKEPSEAGLGIAVTAGCSLEDTEGSPSVDRIGLAASVVPTPV